MNANGTEHSVRFPSGAMHVKSAGDEPVNHMLNLGVCSALLHHNYHELALFPFSIRIGLSFSLLLNYSLELFASGSMAARSAVRASSIMRSNRRRIALFVSGPGLD